MCIFTHHVENVSDTKIAVGMIKSDIQLTVYENQVATSNSNTCMVLPVPNGTNVTFVDVSKKWDWNQIDKKFFPEQEPQYYAMSFGGSSGGFGFEQKLEVITCGGYSASYAPSLADLKRVDSNIFTLPKNIEDILQNNYANNFGFVVCKFIKGKTKNHPIAYTHSLTVNGQMFIPTRHEHGNIEENNQKVIHDQVRCDKCNMNPIEGIRWKCMTCPNFDLCNICFVCDTEHRKKHFFAQLEYSKYSEHNNHSLDFDHTLYLINCVLLSSALNYSELRFAERRLLNQNTFLGTYFPVLNLIQRIEVKNQFNIQYENSDYYAMPILK